MAIVEPFPTEAVAQDFIDRNALGGIMDDPIRLDYFSVRCDCGVRWWFSHILRPAGKWTSITELSGAPVLIQHNPTDIYRILRSSKSKSRAKEKYPVLSAQDKAFADEHYSDIEIAPPPSEAARANMATMDEAAWAIICPTNHGTNDNPLHPRVDIPDSVFRQRVFSALKNRSHQYTLAGLRTAANTATRPKD